MGFWRHDLYSVNGFNELFIGWGLEDTELVYRLYKIGIMRKNIKFSAIAYHLFHLEKSKLNISDNDGLLKITFQTDDPWTRNGLIKTYKNES